MKQKLFNLFPEWFKKLPQSDKIAHCILILPLFFGLSFFIAMWVSCLMTTIIAFTIEFIDKNKKDNHFDWWDILTTIAIPVIVTVFNF